MEARRDKDEEPGLTLFLYATTCPIPPVPAPLSLLPLRQQALLLHPPLRRLKEQQQQQSGRPSAGSGGSKHEASSSRQQQSQEQARRNEMSRVQDRILEYMLKMMEVYYGGAAPLTRSATTESLMAFQERPKID